MAVPSAGHGAGSARLAGALVYVLTPYQLAFTARISVLLLPWAALPWLVGLTMRATRTSGWRAPAAARAGAARWPGASTPPRCCSSPSRPLLWVLVELVRRPATARRVLAGGRPRSRVLGVGVSPVVDGRPAPAGRATACPVLQLTENVRTVAEASTPGDVLRGLGNWFFYGRDRTGYSIDQAGGLREQRPRWWSR